ncbi:MAG: PIN domain-containing protein [Candidatus Levyibacteriota bacterium]
MTNKQEQTIEKAVKKHLQRNFVSNLADEIAKTVVQRLPGVLPKRNTKKKAPKKQKELEGSIFLDTSAIIDGRIFDVIELKLFRGMIVIPESILLELKHIADSQNMVKRERGQRGLADLEKLRKVKAVKVHVLHENGTFGKQFIEVDEKLIHLAKLYKGRIITCDYNLEKKASISGVTAINMHELANKLKITAVPGESLHIKLQHVGKVPTQGVGYLDDGTMVVVEDAGSFVGQFLNVTISRVIATSSGRILFAKRI